MDRDGVPLSWRTDQIVLVRPSQDFLLVTTNIIFSMESAGCVRLARVESCSKTSPPPRGGGCGSSSNFTRGNKCQPAPGPEYQPWWSRTQRWWRRWRWGWGRRGTCQRWRARPCCVFGRGEDFEAELFVQGLEKQYLINSYTRCRTDEKREIKRSVNTFSSAHTLLHAPRLRGGRGVSILFRGALAFDNMFHGHPPNVLPSPSSPALTDIYCSLTRTSPETWYEGGPKV